MLKYKINSFSIYDSRLSDCQLLDAIEFVVQCHSHAEKKTLIQNMDNVSQVFLFLLETFARKMNTMQHEHTTQDPLRRMKNEYKKKHNRFYWYVTVLHVLLYNFKSCAFCLHICIFVTTLQLPCLYSNTISSVPVTPGCYNWQRLRESASVVSCPSISS